MLERFSRVAERSGSGFTRPNSGRICVVMNGVRSFIVAVLLLIPAFSFSADPIAELQARIKNKQVKLDFDAKNGYLSSLLKILEVPISSQTLVFSKTSLQ